MDSSSFININGDSMPTLEILVMMTVMMMLPSIVIMMSSFVRIIIILSFTRNAMGIQQSPPNMVLTGIALFLTLFIMNPVITTINTEAYEPYKSGEITQTEALELAQEPIKEFMLKQTEVSTLNMFIDMSGITQEMEPIELPLTVIIPSFMTSELKRGFMAGLLLYIPFLLLDIVVASTLMSLGMMMLPPATIALPFKILLFVTLDGWELLFSSIVQSFN
jgi:flagellar biosynthetic protein FliP